MKSCESPTLRVSLCMEDQLSYTRRHSTQITHVVSPEGELLDTQEVGVDLLIKGTEEFAFLFRDHLGALLKLDGSTVKVFLWCATNCQLNSNEIALNKHLKGKIAEESDMNLRSVDNALTKLVKKGLLHRIATGHYALTPMVSWKGKFTERTKNVKLFVNYSIDPKLPVFSEPLTPYRLVA